MIHRWEGHILPDLHKHSSFTCMIMWCAKLRYWYNRLNGCFSQRARQAYTHTAAHAGVHDRRASHTWQVECPAAVACHEPALIQPLCHFLAGHGRPGAGEVHIFALAPHRGAQAAGQRTCALRQAHHNVCFAAAVVEGEGLTNLTGAVDVVNLAKCSLQTGAIRKDRSGTRPTGSWSTAGNSRALAAVQAYNTCFHTATKC
jgi:hypothetical protein